MKCIAHFKQEAKLITSSNWMPLEMHKRTLTVCVRVLDFKCICSYAATAKQWRRDHLTMLPFIEKVRMQLLSAVYSTLNTLCFRFDIYVCTWNAEFIDTIKIENVIALLHIHGRHGKYWQQIHIRNQWSESASCSCVRQGHKSCFFVFIQTKFVLWMHMLCTVPTHQIGRTKKYTWIVLQF